jgi:hypothetical protein
MRLAFSGQLVAVGAQREAYQAAEVPTVLKAPIVLKAAFL